MRDFQRTLIESGVPLYWFSDLPPDHPAFAAGQYLALIEAMPGIENDLHFYPDKPITRDEIDLALNKLSAIHSQTIVEAKTKLGDINSMSRAQFAIWLYEIAQSEKLFGKI